MYFCVHHTRFVYETAENLKENLLASTQEGVKRKKKNTYTSNEKEKEIMKILKINKIETQEE